MKPTAPSTAAPPAEATMPNLVPIVRELPADLETPVSVYLKLPGRGPSFLLESITGGEQVARYSFIGVNPGRAYVCRDRAVERHTAINGSQPDLVDTMPGRPGPAPRPRAELRQLRARPKRPACPRFSGGLVGYLGYDVVRFFEPRLRLCLTPPARRHLPAGRHARRVRPCLRPPAADRQRPCQTRTATTTPPGDDAASAGSTSCRRPSRRRCPPRTPASSPTAARTSPPT